MASNASTTITEGTDLENTPNDLDAPVYFPFRKEVFETATEKQRFILLAARDAVLRGESTQTEIAAIADVSQRYVTPALTKYVHRTDLPAAYTLAHNCISRKEYGSEDLTDTQRRIINESTLNPHLSQGDIAEIVGCTSQNVSRTQRLYNDIIQGKNPRDGTIDTPVEADDIPLDDLLKDARDELPVIPEDVPRELLTGFSHDLLMDLTPTKRLILLAAREYTIRGDPCIKHVANTANTSRKNVKRTIAQFRYRGDDYPVAAAVAADFFPDLSYDSLTNTQLHIVNDRVVNPDASGAEIAHRADVEPQYAYHVITMCDSIIEQQRNALA